MIAALAPPSELWRTISVEVSTLHTDPNRFQRREAVDEERLLALEEAGRQHCGMSFCLHRYEPLELWQDPEGRLWVLAGHHRHQLALRAQVRFVDARAMSGPEAEAVAYAARSNARTKPYAPLEEAGIFRDLSDRGWSWERIGAELDGRRPEYYRKRAGLSYLCDALKTCVRDGTLRAEYGEVIGEAARKGLGVAGQQYLRDLARTSGRRIEVFRAVVDALLKRSEEKTTQGLLFDFSSDQAIGQIEEAMRATTEKLRERDLWLALVRVGQQIQRLGYSQEPLIVRTVDEGRRAITQIERDLGLEGSALGDIDDGVAPVATAILKWVGSKRELLPQIVPVVRKALDAGTGKLFEPFAGGASVTLAIGPKAGALSDTAVDLVILYQRTLLMPEAVHAALGVLRAQGTNEETYYKIRDFVSPMPAERAARLIYLNQVGFNGLYRVNKKGQFNVPHGKKADGSDPTPSWPTLADLVAVARALEHVEVRCQTWQEALATATVGDTIYADPPYFGTFDGYGKKWSVGDHAYLADTLRRLYEYGCHVVVSQPDCPETREWYKWTRITDVAKVYAVGGKKKRREGKAAKGELLCIALHDPEASCSG